MGRMKYLIFGLIVGILFLCSNFVFAQASTKEARIILVKEDVKIQKAGKVEWVAAKVEMRLSDGDKIKTGKAAMLELAFDLENKNIVRVYENTTAILRGRWLTQIELPQGRIRSLITKLRSDSSFEIRTPSVIAGAKGSGWDVESEEKRDEVKAQEDEIFVKTFDEQNNLIKEIVITEGWEAIIDRFQGPSELFELTGADRADWDSWKEDLSERTEIERPPVEEKSPEVGTESITEATQERTEYKDQVFETQEDARAEDRAETVVTPPPSSGGVCED